MLDVFKLRDSDQRTVAFSLAILFLLLCWHTTGGKREILEPKQFQFRIDINKATVAELQPLPGIGPKLAENIIQYRDQNSPIDDLDELLNVSGIGPKRYNAIRPYLAN